MTITATEFKTNMGRYIEMVTETDTEITVTKNGKKVMQIIKPRLSGTERLSGILSGTKKNWDYDALKKSALEEKYEITL